MSIQRPILASVKAGLAVRAFDSVRVPELQTFADVFQIFFDPNIFATHPFVYPVPAAVAAWSELKVYINARSCWDDFGFISGNVAVINAPSIPGNVSCYNGPYGVLLGNDGKALNGSVTNTQVGGCGATIFLLWTGYP